jgi:hypothetical protein
MHAATGSVKPRPGGPNLNPVLLPNQKPTDVVLEFGVHKGRRLCEAPSSYLEWIVNYHGATRLATYARDVLGFEAIEDEDPTEATGVLASVAMPYVTFCWWQEMQAKATTPKGRRVVSLGLIELKRLCSRFTRKGWNCDDPPPDNPLDGPNYTTTEGR